MRERERERDSYLEYYVLFGRLKCHFEMFHQHLGA
jgi:hypothetical protein